MPTRPRALHLAIAATALGLTAACVDGGGLPPAPTLPPVGTVPSTTASPTTTTAPTTTAAPTTTTAPTTTAAPTTAAPPTSSTGLPPSSGPRVAFVSPADGATVTSPVAIELLAENFEIEAAGLSRPGAGHFHLLVDQPCLPSGQEIPRDTTHIHLGNGQIETSLDLAPGPHTICLQAGDGVHRALPLTDTLSIVVAPST
ncbi:MAG: DUF4399 domain-containing protein [Acidimicrobiia bacterium]|nr:DUF4399 domain-containing protein [Acidimicrobiia bacterium]